MLTHHYTLLLLDDFSEKSREVWHHTEKHSEEQELATPEGRLRWAAGMPPPDAPGGPGQQQQPFEEYVPGIGR